MVANNNEPLSRPLADFSPTVWGDHFASHPLTMERDSYTTVEIEDMKEKVKGALVSPSINIDHVRTTKLIDLLCRLGLSYHFENEIEELLTQIFDAQFISLTSDHNYDLYSAALIFRIFRQFGFKISCDIFNKFKDFDGKFNESLISDARGLLSLYEASYLRIHGEDIMEEALAFATTHLKNILAANNELKMNIVSPNLIKQITNALIRPLHQGIPRIETRQFILAYEANEYEDIGDHEMLLKFAKLDFNFLRSLYEKELSIITRWHKGLDLISKLPYLRDRVVEMYLWTVGAYFQPEYSRARIMLAKVTTLTLLSDDTYDAFGTIEELDLFTAAIQRWDDGASDQLPDYMKFLYATMLNICNDLESEVIEDGKSHLVLYVKDELKKLVAAHYVEARWCNKSYVPTYDEYIVNGFVTSTYDIISIGALLGMREVIGVDPFEWLQTGPKLLRASEVIGRVMDDIVSHHDEQKRKYHVASSVECYMKQYGVNREVAVEALRSKISDAWKDMNEESLRPTTIPRYLSTLIINLSRVIDFVYKYHDGFTHPENIKESLTSLFIDEI